MSTQAIATPIQVSNTEILITPAVLIPAGTASVGDTYTITINGLLGHSAADDPYYNFNIRMGANGNVSDASIFNSNNIVSQSSALADLIQWNTLFPGYSWNDYQFPHFSNSEPTIPLTPQEINGTLQITVVSIVGNVANVAIVAPILSSQLDNNNLMTAMGAGVLGYGSFNPNVTNYISASHSLTPAGYYRWLPGYGDPATPGGQFAYHTGSIVNSVINFSSITTPTLSGNGGGSGSYQTDVYFNGTEVLANSTVNFTNSTTVNASVVANGTTRTNVSFSVNTSAIGGGSNATPGGSNTTVQFNNNGSLGGSSNLTYNTASQLLSAEANVRIANNNSLYFGGSQSNTVANSHFQVTYNVAASSLDYIFLG